MNKQVILITPPPVYENDLEMWNRQKGKKITRDRNNENTLLYAQQCLKLGEKYNVPVVDLFTGLEGSSVRRQNYFVDGLHLNAR